MSFLLEVLEFLVAAIVVVPIFKRLGLSSVLGYLGAGILLGRHGLGLVADVDEVLHFAEIGVVFLLFIIGLELQPRRLWVMRRTVLGLGPAQVVASAVVLAGLVRAVLGVSWASSSIVGFALALSSTAFVLQLLGEQRKLNAPHGRAAFGTLLFQDVAVIPVIALLDVAGGGAAPARSGLAVGGALVAVVLGGVAARFALRPVLRVVASTAIHELFTAASLALVLGAALAMSAAGLSMGLGAFAAGMMVADSEYRHQLETDLMPFKGLLLGLFFMGVGMAVDLRLLAAEPLAIVGSALLLVAVKGAVLLPLARWNGLGMVESLRAATVLSQGGEFAFVLLATAVGAGLLDPGLSSRVAIVVTLSMVTTPILSGLLERHLAGRREERPYDVIDEPENPVVIAGFGRFGQIVARVLSMRSIRFTALEVSPAQVDFVRRFGNQIYFGDAGRQDLLQTAHIASAKVFVVAVDDTEAALRMAAFVRSHFPSVTVVARARNRLHDLQLREIGVPVVIRDTLHSSLEAADQVLRRLGVPDEEARASVETFRAHDARTLERQQALFHDDEAFRESTKNAAEQVREVFEADHARTASPGGADRSDAGKGTSAPTRP